MGKEFKFSETIVQAIMEIHNAWGVPSELLMKLVDLARTEGECWAYKLEPAERNYIKEG